ncbi:zinc ribbon domain-containing protein [Mycolicibacterium sp. 018/SC-01/001]|uniref:FmdB family zinc ribbon protein n=1 Tax=Mycolicibacterium sp. 018/SC-01/001 TaxID=2592069 RepID=UPI00163D4A06|nr:zinc ribbon domain-containing protein [Mycolicibacterium sp. 018/SC-01/001]
MILYAFRCETGCGTTQQMYSMDSRPDEIDCPACQGPARRLMAAPHLGRSAGAAMALHDATRATADRPAVVSSPTPPPSGRPISTNPLHQKLPRP